MNLKNFIKDKKNLAYVVLLSTIIILCSWAFIAAGIMTKSFKNKIIEQSYQNKEANIENLLVTETKDGEKLWELFADVGRYSDSDNIVNLENLIGNFYDKKVVKASFKADNGTYDAKKKEILLYSNVILVYDDGTYIKADKIDYKGKNEDIVAEGNVMIEKPNEAVIMGTKAVLTGDFADFHIEGRTKTKFYM